MKLVYTFILVISTFCAFTESVYDGSFISINEAPFYAQLFLVGDHNLPEHLCGGTIISETWIVTAAHCTGIDNIQIRVGGVSDAANLHVIEKIIVHGGYETMENGTLDSDIALIKLKKPIEFNEYQQPMKVTSKLPKAGDKVQIYGLGLQGRGLGGSPAIKTAEVIVLDQDECERVIFPSKSSFCAGGNGTTDTCNGDSGTGSIINGELSGIASWGSFCPEFVDNEYDEFPGVYTRVAQFYNWIMKHTGIQYT